MLTMVIPSPTRSETERSAAAPSLLALLQNWAPEKLLILGSGPVPVNGATEGMLALNAAGDTVLAISIPSMGRLAATQIADELDRLAQMSGPDLHLSVAHPSPDSSIRDRFTDLFGAPPDLNRKQSVILVLGSEPDATTWRALSSELGGRVRGVYRRDAVGLTALAAPDTAVAEPIAPWSLGTSLAAGAIVLGVGLALLAVAHLFDPSTPTAPTGVVVPAIKTVATGVPGGATHTQWIGQQHLVHTSGGRLLALFAVPGGLQIVTDGGDQGATWGPPASVTAVQPDSFAAAIDSRDRLHLAFRDADGVAYAVLQESQGEWSASDIVRLDAGAKTPLVDVAWDESRQVAHIVWAKDVGAGQEPYWAALGSSDGKPKVIDSGPVAPEGDAVPVLVDEAADAGSGKLLVTYRKGTSPSGWWSRIAVPSGKGAWRWDRPERLPTDASIGAAALAFDRGGTAHLVLRDSTDYRLLYLSRSEKSGWSKPEVAVQAHATSQVDFPALVLDNSSKLIYVFFESDQFETAPEILVAVRDPNSGWQEPTSVAALPEGDYFPTALRNASGQAIALWTRGSATASLEAVRVTAP
jgi:hypothetical protein